jgi:small-conductance mechanosensitive channel
MNKPLEQLLKEATKDLLTEESLKSISEAFQTQVDATVAAAVEKQLTEQTDAAVKQALEEQDTEYTAKLEKLLEAIDVDHTTKLEKIVSRVDENHSAKLLTLAEKYDTAARKEAEAFKTKLVEKVSKFLDNRLTESIPTAQITEAVANTRAKKLIDRIRETVALDEKFVTNEIRTALQDGKKQIDESKQTAVNLSKQVKVLTEQSTQLRTSLLLEQKTIGLPKEKKDYVVKVLKGKDEKFITENFKYVVDMFEKNEDKEVETLKESTVGITSKEKIDHPVVIEEAAEQFDNEMAGYLQGLKSD